MRINPMVALLFNFTLPIAIMFPGNKYQHLFFLAFATVTLLISGKLKRAAKFVFAYAVMYTVYCLMLNYGNAASKLIGMLVMMSVQFVPCMMIASVLVKDYSAGEIISALEPVRLPKPILVSLTIVVRYIPTFKNEFKFMKESMRLRNIPFSIKRPIKSFEYFLVPQLFRCSLLANEITAAALTKGITNPDRRTSYYGIRMMPVDYIMCAVLIVGTGVFILWR